MTKERKSIRRIPVTRSPKGYLMRREDKQIIITCKSIEEAMIVFEKLKAAFVQQEIQQLLRETGYKLRRIPLRRSKYAA